WNSFVEEKVVSESGAARKRTSSSGDPHQAARPVRIKQVSSSRESRIDTGIGELNRVLGGGLVKGSITLITGEPGIGKSTIIIQAAASIAERVGTVLYVSGEESEQQIKMRADRVCRADTENLYLLAETCMDDIDEAVREMQPAFLIIDSIQTMYCEGLESAPGSVSQVRACGNALMNIAKGLGIPVFAVAHVTKSGELAGPKIVEHMVDTVLQFTGERSQDLRILRSLKNRFGTTSEIGAFEMREEGLIEVDNLSGSFLEGFEDSQEGAVATAVYEGTRPLLLEIQALTGPSGIGFARRTGLGIDTARLNMIIAVLERKAGLSLISRDVYVNVVGGLKPEGTSTDLAAAAAIWSAEKGIAIPHGTLIIGEIGLTGDLRPVMHAEKLCKEAARLGFDRIVLPKRSLPKAKDAAAAVELVGVTTLRDALQASQEAHGDALK
ncbi:MAG: DNA repair protein RadA, partial [Clostridia bacterium]|nr:DNA repair protein RadA [Clostridia bacterium]